MARRALFAFLILLFINEARAQSDTLWADGKRTVLFVGLELIDLDGTLTQWPYYSSTDGALIEDLRKVIRYPECAFAHSLTGDVDVQFRVEMDGSISTVKVTYGNSACLNDAALTAVRLLPDFTRHATRDGRSVAAKMKLTLSFQMRGIETGNDERSNFVRLSNKGTNELRAARYDAAVEAYSAAIAVNDRWMINYFGRVPNNCFPPPNKFSEAPHTCFSVPNTCFPPADKFSEAPHKSLAPPNKCLMMRKSGFPTRTGG